jgi:hypothetical protein
LKPRAGPPARCVLPNSAKSTGEPTADFYHPRGDGKKYRHEAPAEEGLDERQFFDLGAILSREAESGKHFLHRKPSPRAGFQAAFPVPAHVRIRFCYERGPGSAAETGSPLASDTVLLSVLDPDPITFFYRKFQKI